MIYFVISTVFLAPAIMSGCSRQKFYVYEKIPEASECRRYTEYFQVSKCNLKHHFSTNKKLYRTIQINNHQIKRKFNQKVKCTDKNNRPVPTACYVPHLPSRLTFQHMAKLLTDNQS